MEVGVVLFSVAPTAGTNVGNNVGVKVVLLEDGAGDSVGVAELVGVLDGPKDSVGAEEMVGAVLFSVAFSPSPSTVGANVGYHVVPFGDGAGEEEFVGDCVVGTNVGYHVVTLDDGAGDSVGPVESVGLLDGARDCVGAGEKVLFSVIAL